MSSEVVEEDLLPEPPEEPGALAPLLERWPRGRSFFRCHNLRFAPREFNPGYGGGRFHPFADVAGNPVSTLYAANLLDGALSETVFHGISVRGPLKTIALERLRPLGMSVLAPRRELTLVQLYGFGLLRLGVSRAELIASSPGQYHRTVRWARALHACRPNADGLIWVSRQNDGSYSLVLFGDRVTEEDLRIVRRPVPLMSERGFAHVQKAAEAAGIMISEDGPL